MNSSYEVLLQLSPQLISKVHVVACFPRITDTVVDFVDHDGVVAAHFERLRVIAFYETGYRMDPEDFQEGAKI